MIVLIILAIVLLAASSVAGSSDVCQCSTEENGVCYYSLANGTQRPADIWACDTINGTLQVDVSGNLSSVSYLSFSFYLEWMHGDIEFYADSTLSHADSMTVKFPFLQAIVGTIRFDLPDNIVTNLTVNMLSLECWTTQNAPYGTLMSLDSDIFHNIKMNMHGFNNMNFNATGVIEVKKLGMIDLSNVRISSLSSLILSDVHNAGTRFIKSFGYMSEITNMLSISGAMGSNVDWFPNLLSSGNIVLFNNSAGVQFPALKKISSGQAQDGSSSDYSVALSENTGLVTIGTASGQTNSTIDCNCHSNGTGTCVDGGGWVGGIIDSLCLGGGYKPTNNPVCSINGTDSTPSTPDSGAGHLAAWLIAVIVIVAVLCCVCLPLALCGACAGIITAASQPNHHTTQTTLAVPSSIATADNVVISSPMAPQAGTSGQLVTPLVEDGSDFHTRRMTHQNATQVAPPPNYTQDYNTAGYNNHYNPPAPPVVNAQPVMDYVPSQHAGRGEQEQELPPAYDV